MRRLALLLLLAGPAQGAVFEVVCGAPDSERYCSGTEKGKVVTVYAVAAPGPLLDDWRQQVRCVTTEVDKEECQAARLRDALAADWQQEIACSLDLVKAGVCDVEEVGQQIRNPTAKTEFADKRLLSMLARYVIARESKLRHSAVQEPPGLILDGGSR